MLNLPCLLRWIALYCSILRLSAVEQNMNRTLFLDRISIQTCFQYKLVYSNIVHYMVSFEISKTRACAKIGLKR